MAQIGRHKKNQGGNEKSDRNQLFRKKRAVKKPAVNLDRFAGSSEDEAKPKRKARPDGSIPIDGNRAAKRARKELAKQKEKERSDSSVKKQAPVASGEEKQDQSSPKVASVLAPKTKKKEEPDKKEKKTAPSPASGWKLKGGVVAKDITVGPGKPAKPGCKVSITYEGCFPDGKVFDQNLNRNSPLQFRIGSGEVVEGMEVGVAGMKSGGKRIITIPPKMGYGDEGSPPDIPGGATLQFKVELVSFEPASVVKPIKRSLAAQHCNSR